MNYTIHKDCGACHKHYYGGTNTPDTFSLMPRTPIHLSAVRIEQMSLNVRGQTAQSFREVMYEL